MLGITTVPFGFLTKDSSNILNDALTPFVINWHITEKCNYRCGHCFAKWNHPAEIWESVENIRAIIDNIDDYCTRRNIWNRRLNIVGGEPILQPERLWNVAEYAYEKNFRISLITNGSHLENVLPFAHIISMIGISIDSLDHETNIRIGRECCQKTLSLESLRNKMASISSVNPAIEFKINTVVNKFNYNEILVNDLAELNIQKWKILRQLPFGNNPGISDYMFYAFLRNNYKTELLSKEAIFVESNEAMTESYLMLSPDGRIFQNGDVSYRYSTPLTETPFEKALGEIQFDKEKFDARYNTHTTEEVIYQMENFFHLNSNDDDLDFDCYMDFSDKD